MLLLLPRQDTIDANNDLKYRSWNFRLLIINYTLLIAVTGKGKNKY